MAINAQFSEGFQDGYKKGYCLGDGNCLPPIPPIIPIPAIGENYDSYQDGYNRGFQMGLDAKRNNNANNNGSGGTYKQVVPPAKYAPSVPLDIYERGIAEKARQNQELATLRAKSLDDSYSYLQKLDRLFSECYPNTNHFNGIEKRFKKVALLIDSEWKAINDFIATQENYYITNINKCRQDAPPNDGCHYKN